MDNEKFMEEAIRLSVESVKNGGGPFGAVIVKEGKIIAGASNSVTLNNDPTAHAEVNAIRKACKALNTFSLEGCELYTSCEPCPMCLSAIYWAHIDRIYYGNTKEDAKAIDFDDSFIYEQIPLAPAQRAIPARQLMRDAALEAFRLWDGSTDKTKY